ncbi:MAG: hypothetical protein SX243_14670 [Acidobacteriota bacterium]|nr:hypothetical protein [Acidobacteriota bacterium]
MRRHLPWILTLMLCLPLFASAAEIDRAASRSLPEVDPSLLFFALTDGLADADGQLSFEFLVDGVLMARENVQLPGHAPAPATSCNPELDIADTEATLKELQSQPAPAAVEILARQPNLLAAVQRHADEGSAVEVRIAFDGQMWEQLSLGELRERSGNLLAAPTELRRTASELSEVADQLLADEPVALVAGYAPSTCEGYCAQDLLQCQIVCNGNAACEQQCTDIYDDCIAGCEPCSGPTVRTYTVTTLVSQTYLGVTQCLKDFYQPSSKRWYDYLQIQKKHTTYRETTQCDGSQSTVVVSVSYTTTNCWNVVSFSSCSIDQGTALPICF